MPYITHRDPALWPDPERFDPERFTPEKIANRPKQIYYPFREGPHVCNGNNFTMMEMQFILWMTIQRFRLNLVPGHPIAFKPEATLRSKYEMKMIVESI